MLIWWISVDVLLVCMTYLIGYSAHFDGGQFPDYLKLQYVSSIPLTTEHSQEFTSNLVILGR